MLIQDSGVPGIDACRRVCGLVPSYSGSVTKYWTLNYLTLSRTKNYVTSKRRKTVRQRHGVTSQKTWIVDYPPPSLGATELAHFPVAQLHKQKLTGMTSESAGEETCSFTTSDHPWTPTVSTNVMPLDRKFYMRTCHGHFRYIPNVSKPELYNSALIFPNVWQNTNILHSPAHTVFGCQP
jgi:hypothetical protein